MNNLYVFAIGGSGERVMKSLVMMLAAGVKVNAKNIIPIIIDNDANNDALTTCEELIKRYRSTNTQRVGLQQIMRNVGNLPAPSFAQANIDEPIILNVSGATVPRLRGLIGANDNTSELIEKSIIEERDLLFSNDDLDMKLNVGFIGNPNIGSVVLNRLSINDQTLQEDVFNTANTNDGVFVIGSLFGGTGAAGFPLIVNKFLDKQVANRPLVGGVALLPYFDAIKPQINNQQNNNRYEVKCESFDAKSRTALIYYDEYMNQMHYQYYVGDNKARTKYVYSIGGPDQKNSYNIIEAMAAMTIIDFSKQATNNKPTHIVYKLPNWKFDKDKISTAFDIPNRDLRRSLVKFQMMKVLFENDSFLKKAIDNKNTYVVSIGFDQTQLNDIQDQSKDNIDSISNAWGLKYFFKEWNKWMEDLNRNEKKLNIFDQEATKTLSPEELTTKFTGNKFGIAKTEFKRERPFLNKKSVETAINPDVLNKINSTYEKNKGQLAQGRCLNRLMFEISTALDSVLNDTCKKEFSITQTENKK